MKSYRLRIEIVRTVLGVSLWALSSAFLQAMDPQPHVQARLVSEVKTVQPGRPFWVAVKLKMDKGWHTYWKNPGDAGLQTKVKWELPEGWKAGPIQWPSPVKFGKSPVISYGYKDEVSLLVRMEPGKSIAGEKASLSARVKWLECAEICVMGKADLNIEIPVDKRLPEIDPDHARTFSDTRSRLPVKNPGWAVEALRKGKKIVISVQPARSSQKKVSSILFFPLNKSLIDEKVTQKFYRKGESFFLDCGLSPDAGPVSTLKGVLILKYGRGAGESVVEVHVPLG